MSGPLFYRTRALIEDHQIIVFSDVADRDGLGVELWDGDAQLAEAFRDDTAGTFTFTTFDQDLPVVLVEEFISLARKRLEVASP